MVCLLPRVQKHFPIFFFVFNEIRAVRFPLTANKKKILEGGGQKKTAASTRGRRDFGTSAGGVGTGHLSTLKEQKKRGASKKKKHFQPSSEHQGHRAPKRLQLPPPSPPTPIRKKYHFSLLFSTSPEGESSFFSSFPVSLWFLTSVGMWRRGHHLYNFSPPSRRKTTCKNNK